jgi:hypothetical protein
MNAKKMELLKQSQLKSAKEIDALSNLVVETKLVPSQTRTVIETNTNTGNVLAVATGGQIATGSAQAESYSSQKMAAIPNAGELRQGADVTRGDMIQDSTGRKVGEGAIVNTMTNVSEQKDLAAGQRGGDVNVNARPLQADQSRAAPIAHREQPAAPITHGGASSGLLSQQELDRHAASHPPINRSAAAHHDGSMPAGAVVNPDSQLHKETLHNKEDPAGIAYDKHDSSSTHGAEPHQHGLICKVKHALGMDSSREKHAHDQAHNVGEPRSSDATKRV